MCKDIICLDSSATNMLSYESAAEKAAIISHQPINHNTHQIEYQIKKIRRNIRFCLSLELVNMQIEKNQHKKLASILDCYDRLFSQ